MTMQVFEVPQFKVDRSKKLHVETLVDVDGIWMTLKEASEAHAKKCQAFLEKKDEDKA